MRALHVLLIEDSEEDAELVVRELRRGGFAPTFRRVETRETMAAALEGEQWDIVISDYSMPAFDAPGALSVVRERGVDVPVIIVSGTIGEDTAVEALQAGASDFIVKGRLSRLVPAIERELREKAGREAKRRAEDRAREAEDRYRLLFATCPLPMWVYDTSTLAILEVNEAAVTHYGYSREEFARLTLADIRPPEDVAALREATANVEHSHDGRAWRHRKKDGSIITVEIKARSFNFAGRPARLVVANDVTDKLRLEEQSRRAQKMEAIGKLAGGVAHDFNNLLSVILSYTGLLLAGLTPGDPAKADLDEVRKAGERAADLTRQLLAFSRQQMLQPRVLDLNQVIRGMERMLRRLLGEDIEFSMLTAQSVGKMLADPGQVEQVIMNLVVNARDAMPTGGKLIVETENVELDAEYAALHLDVVPGHYVMLADHRHGNGHGQRDGGAHLRAVLHDQGKGKRDGPGPVHGLRHREAERWAHLGLQRTGQGHDVQGVLPAYRGARGSTSTRSSSSPPTLRGTETVLLVEDEDQVRAIMRAVLRRYGYNVLEAQNGGEAFLICEKFTAKIHLLIADVVMPRMSGREVAERLMPMRPDMKVLYVSGYTENTVVHHGVLDSGIAFLQKPITPEALARRVREVLDEPGPKT